MKDLMKITITKNPKVFLTDFELIKSATQISPNHYTLDDYGEMVVTPAIHKSFEYSLKPDRVDTNIQSQNYLEITANDGDNTFNVTRGTQNDQELDILNVNHDSIDTVIQMYQEAGYEVRDNRVS